jgi:hypothetical protein
MAQVKLTDLVLDFDLYPRNGLSSPNINSIVDALEMGDPIPPIVADKESKRVVDGFHRYKAHQKLKREKIEVTWRNYKGDAEMFADAVRLNRQHGQPFDTYDLKRSVQRLLEFGLKPKDVSDIVRVPRNRIDVFVGEFAKGPGQRPVVVKGGLSSLRGRTINQAQVNVNEKYSGYQPAFHVNQLVALLKANIIPETVAFQEGMDELCDLWAQIRKKKSA